MKTTLRGSCFCLVSQKMTRHYAKGKMKLEMSQVIQFCKEKPPPRQFVFYAGSLPGNSGNSSGNTEEDWMVSPSVAQFTKWRHYSRYEQRTQPSSPRANTEYSHTHVIPSYLLNTANLSISSLPMSFYVHNYHQVQDC